MSEYHKKEDESWNEERVWHTDKLAKLHAELEEEKEKVEYARVKRVRVEASKQTVEKSAPPPDKPHSSLTRVLHRLGSGLRKG